MRSVVSVTVNTIPTSPHNYDPKYFQMRFASRASRSHFALIGLVNQVLTPTFQIWLDQTWHYGPGFTVGISQKDG